MTPHAREVARYMVNGLVATAVHYGVLTVNLELLAFQSAGTANLVAAVFGIASSFLGSRHFVFPNSPGGVLAQAIKFSGLYGAIALLHGAILLIWSDWHGYDYRLGFLFATACQVSLSYLGNKYLVFSK